MELRVLRYFLAVAQEESISAAADYLHLTQPTLSRQLKDLEEELGRPLLVRGSRKVTLTEEGRLLRKRAREILELADKAQAEVREGEGAVTGEVYIGAGETHVMRLVARAVRDLREQGHHIRFRLYSGNAEDVTERLDQGLLDFGILIQPVDLKKYDSLRLPATDLWGVLMPKDHPLAQEKSIRPQQLRRQPLLISHQRLHQGQLLQWLGCDITDLDVAATYNLIYNAARMVEEGVGLALTLDRLVSTGEDSPLCFRPLEPPIEVGLDIVWKKYQVLSKAAQLFLGQLQANFPGPQGPKSGV